MLLLHLSIPEVQKEEKQPIAPCNKINVILLAFHSAIIIGQMYTEHATLDCYDCQHNRCPMNLIPTRMALKAFRVVLGARIN